MMSEFNDAFIRLMRHEGGYVNHVRDPGGETKFGISKRSYPDVDIAGLTMNQAGEIYKRDFWDVLQCDKIHPDIAFNLFDGAVNSGHVPAVRWLQQALSVDNDGIMGPATVAACNAQHASTVIRRFNGYRLGYLVSLKTFDTFGKGWARRIANNLVES